MNVVVLNGRLTRDPVVRYSSGENPVAVARFTLAVERRFAKRDDPNAQTADFISCVAIGRQGEFVDKYLRQGMKIAMEGEIRTGSYEKDGQKIYTTEVYANRFEFAESRNNSGQGDGNTAPVKHTVDSNTADSNTAKKEATDTGFMKVNDEIEEDLPFA